MNRVFLLFLTFLTAVSAIACGDTSPAVNSSNNATVAERVCSPITDTPTEAYKRLYAAVKSKDTAVIKGEMSKDSQEFAESLAMRQKNPIEKVYENGFTGTTFSPTLPEIRDERVSSCWGGVEVRNQKENRWEDLPFVNEDGKWKFAIGEMFGGTYVSPGKNMDTIEREAANVARGNLPINTIPTENVNTAISNSNSKTAPKYDGPQVEPLPKKK